MFLILLLISYYLFFTTQSERIAYIAYCFFMCGFILSLKEATFQPYLVIAEMLPLVFFILYRTNKYLKSQQP
jgi:hypothetical protein